MKTILALNSTLQAFSSAALPEELLLVPAGQFAGRDGRGWSNPNPQLVINAAQDFGLDIAIDIEHSTELKGPKGDPAPAMAWIAIADLFVRDGAIWGKVQWTDAGKALIEGKAYRYYSPAFRHDATGYVTTLSSVGLTNRANLTQLPALNHQQEKPMDKILTKLGLRADATEDAAVAAIDKLGTDHLLALNSAQQVDVTKFIPAETHQLALNRATTAEAAIAASALASLESEATTVVDAAIAGGQVAPANRDQYLALCRAEGGLEQVKTLFSSAPKVLAPAQDLSDKPPGTGASKLDETQLAMCRQLALTEAEFLSAQAAD